MTKAQRRRVAPASEPAPTQAGPSKWAEVRGWRGPAIIVAAVLFFYWIPLTSSDASIQWDAVDVHYSSQKYFGDHVLKGVLPFWTPYIFSGFPFLADIQTGAWYPLNWPFFIAGITPKAIQAEIALHAFLALLGAWLLLRRFVSNRVAALAGAVAYEFTGYFADHASHVGMFAAAALMPWLLLCFHIGLERSAAKFTALGGLLGGALILAGHFQNALYSFCALALFAAAVVIEQPAKLRRAALVVSGIAVLAAGLSAIQTLPGLELTAQSLRAVADYSRTAERSLRPSAIAGILLPLGGAPGEANIYLYSGLLTLPLAVLGFRNRRVRWPAMALIVLPVWYMLGPAAGLYRVAVLIPGFRNIRAPAHMWFVAAMGVALLAAAGAEWLFNKTQSRPVLAAVVALLFADLFYFNSFTNVLAYARHSFDDLYGNREQVAREKLAPMIPPVTRYDAPDLLTMFGPLNHPLDLGVETTYGYNPLELRSYAQYREVMKRNPALRSGLNVSVYFDAQAGGARQNPDVLPRAYFARSVVTATSEADSLRRLETLDPARATLVLDPSLASLAAPDGSATISEDGEQGYTVHYKTARRSLVKLSAPYFPGWQAAADGAPCPIVRADHALMGIVVPPGEHDLIIRFRSNYFAAGVAVSAIFCIGALGILLAPVLLLKRNG
jgi:hypothetical protein